MDLLQVKFFFLPKKLKFSGEKYPPRFRAKNYHRLRRLGFEIFDFEKIFAHFLPHADQNDAAHANLGTLRFRQLLTF